MTSDVPNTTRKTSAGPPATTPSPARRTSTSTCSSPIRAIASPKPTTWRLNGWEIGGGSVRIHRADVRERSSPPSTLGRKNNRPKFGFLLDALSTARRPRRSRLRPRPHRHHDDRRRIHPRRDRLPKTQRAQCLLTNAPSPVDEKQLRELHIRLRQRPGSAGRLIDRAVKAAAKRGTAWPFAPFQTGLSRIGPGIAKWIVPATRPVLPSVIDLATISALIVEANPEHADTASQHAQHGGISKVQFAVTAGVAVRKLRTAVTT